MWDYASDAWNTASDAFNAWDTASHALNAWDAASDALNARDTASDVWNAASDAYHTPPECPDQAHITCGESQNRHTGPR